MNAEYLYYIWFHCVIYGRYGAQRSGRETHTPSKGGDLLLWGEEGVREEARGRGGRGRGEEKGEMRWERKSRSV